MTTSPPLFRAWRVASRAAAANRRTAKTSIATRAATIAVSPRSAYVVGVSVTSAAERKSVPLGDFADAVMNGPTARVALGVGQSRAPIGSVRAQIVRVFAALDGVGDIQPASVLGQQSINSAIARRDEVPAAAAILER